MRYPRAQYLPSNVFTNDFTRNDANNECKKPYKKTAAKTIMGDKIIDVSIEFKIFTNQEDNGYYP
jgi:hypothetical protein